MPNRRRNGEWFLRGGGVPCPAPSLHGGTHDYHHARMTRPSPVLVLLIGACAAAIVAAGCGSQEAESEPGAQLFAARCGGCHTLEAAGTEGSSGARPTGPNLNQRRETRNQVLYAIRNGGFSGAIMPQNIVVGAEAQAVADFVAKNAGSKAKNPPSPKSPSQGATGSTGATGESGSGE
jgi:cytochrome c551